MSTYGASGPATAGLVRYRHGMHWDWLDPIHGVGYQWWSGMGGNLAPLLIAALIWFRPSRCQELGCRRRAVKRHTLHGYPVCRVHDDAPDTIAAGRDDTQSEAG